MGRGAKIFFLSALAAGCVFGLVSFLIISSVTAGVVPTNEHGNIEDKAITVFCLDKNDTLCSIVKITAGERITVDFCLPDSETAEAFMTRGYSAVFDKNGKSDYYAIIPQSSVGAIASSTGASAPVSLTAEGDVRRFSLEVTERLLKPDGDKIFGLMAEELDTDLTQEALVQIINSRKIIK